MQNKSYQLLNVGENCIFVKFGQEISPVIHKKVKRLSEYLEQNQYQVKRIAVELNGDILPKYSYSETMLKDGDRLEVVTFVGGG